MTGAVRYWAVVPAAGAGTRMQTDLPKQYLTLKGRRIIEFSLETFCAHAQIAGVTVALATGDKLWEQLPCAHHPKVKTAPGGKERCHSVLNSLRVLAEHADANDWVLVHDAARPCLWKEDIDQLLTALSNHPVGGLLALPVRDTMKRAENHTGKEPLVSETINRQGLWHALTPQMFRLRPLIRALEQAQTRGQIVTDESQAMELAGFKPLLVEGRAENIKITRPSDLRLAELYLA